MGNAKPHIIRIREAQISDLFYLHLIMHQCQQQHPDTYTYPHNPIYTLDKLIYHLGFVATDHKDRPIAFCLLDDIIDPLYPMIPARALKLANTAVAPKYQGKHLEYRLACYALAHYKKRHDFSYAWCTIHPHNPASIKSLANAGFRLYQANYVTPYGIRNIYIQKI